MNAFLTDAAQLLIQVAFGIFIFAVLIRFLLQVSRADFYNPISQLLVSFTNPLLRPLRRVIPGFFGIDFASVVLLLALKWVELALVVWLKDIPAQPLAILVSAVIDLLILTINVYFFAVIVRVLLSWFTPYGIRHNPAGGLLVSLTEPLLAPARRAIPPLGGMDLSPVVVLVGLQLIQLALSHLLR
jgi:YggT family protein